MYKIIDETLRIASCRVSELTMQQVTRFLDQWEKGAPIGSLTLFYDEKENLVVLNRDNQEFDRYLELAIRHMTLGREGCRRVEGQEPESLKETVAVLKNAARQMRYREKLRIIDKNVIAEEHLDVLFYSRTHSDNSYLLSRRAFLYGFICGKRMERSRRRKANVSRNNEANVPSVSV